MLPLLLSLHQLVTSRWGRDEGQTSAEYALVVMAAVAVAVVVGAWAHSTNKIGDLLDTLFDAVRAKIS